MNRRWRNSVPAGCLNHWNPRINLLQYSNYLSLRISPRFQGRPPVAILQDSLNHNGPGLTDGGMSDERQVWWKNTQLYATAGKCTNRQNQATIPPVTTRCCSLLQVLRGANYQSPFLVPPSPPPHSHSAHSALSCRTICGSVLWRRMERPCHPTWH